MSPVYDASTIRVHSKGLSFNEEFIIWCCSNANCFGWNSAWFCHWGSRANVNGVCCIVTIFVDGIWLSLVARIGSTTAVIQIFMVPGEIFKETSVISLCGAHSVVGSTLAWNHRYRSISTAIDDIDTDGS